MDMHLSCPKIPIGFTIGGILAYVAPIADNFAYFGSRLWAQISHESS
jgi:hypothetical protein